MLDLPEVPILVMKHDYKDYPWHVLDESGTLLAIGRYPPAMRKRPKFAPPMNLLTLHFSTPGGDLRFIAARGRPSSCTVTGADGVAYGAVHYRDRWSRRRDTVQYSLMDSRGDLIGQVTSRPFGAVDPELATWPYFVSDHTNTDVGRVIRHTNHDAARIELRFTSPASPQLVVLCIAAEARQRTTR